MISVLFLILGYLIGSINFSIIFTHIFSNTDVRDHGSGNAGFTNTLRVSGKKVATLVFVCDAAKAAFAIVLAILYAKYAGNYDA
ncbi:MAG: glycerol-3-phosphate acyltransferase, partial [Clostridia bacterium]|nr:glycerol-3-phosphate acyltransferase [Clostridia bacterium]